MNQEENNNWIRFSTGLTTVQKWSAEKKMMQQRMEEDHLAGTFEILSNFIECCNIDEKTIYNLTKIKMPSYAFVAFGYFLKIPGYSKLILRDRKLAHFILKLLLGSNDKIHQSSLCLSSMTFDTLRELLYLSFKQQNETEIDKKTKLSLSEFLTKNSILALILSILSSISHHPHTKLKPHFERKFLPDASSFYSKDASLKIYKETMEILYGHYWVKSHCFGTGYTFQQWDTQRKIMQKRLEEEHVICLLEILSSFIEYYNDSDENLNEHLNLIIEIFNDSCITNVLSSYLRNDSVLDISINIPLYKSVLKLVQAFTYQSEFQTLISKCNIYDLIKNMKQLFDSYFKKIKFNEEEDLARFFNVLNLTYELVKKCLKSSDEILSNLDDSNDATESKENKYCEALKQFQFDSYSIVRKMENGILKADVPYYYEPLLNHPAYYYNLNRPKRLAQEAVTISNSLPISLSSTVFVRCDEERLDIMKVLITGPQDTPYANGCFEFDVFFPPDYPYSPPLINLQTTGNQTVRFNPNLYHDGKVCLSILNTWQGRPEELWNEKTSTFLQVLVSIQSLILVSQPYFNEPGYEGLIGTPAGIALSTEYDANIRQATVKWAMLEALKNPPICFKEPIRKHFLLKRKEIKKQCERWLNEMKLLIDDKQIGLSISESYIKLKLNMIQLFEELDKLKKN